MLVGAETLPGFVPGLNVDDVDDDWLQIDEVIVDVTRANVEEQANPFLDADDDEAERRSILCLFFCDQIFEFCFFDMNDTNTFLELKKKEKINHQEMF